MTIGRRKKQRDQFVDDLIRDHFRRLVSQTPAPDSVRPVIHPVVSLHSRRSVADGGSRAIELLCAAALLAAAVTAPRLPSAAGDLIAERFDRAGVSRSVEQGIRTVRDLLTIGFTGENR